jgi:hypothetical protein
MEKYRMMKKAGALQEAVDLDIAPPPPMQQAISNNYTNAFSSNIGSFNNNIGVQSLAAPPPFHPQEQAHHDPYADADYVSRHHTGAYLVPPAARSSTPFHQMRRDERAAIMRTQQQNEPSQTMGGAGVPNYFLDPRLANQRRLSAMMTNMEVKMGLFFYTIPEGQRVLLIDKKGRGELIDGPRRVSAWGKKLTTLSQYTAYPGEFLIVRFRDGSQEHLPGPVKVWFDPRIHTAIDKEDALQIAAKEAIIVYSTEKSEDSEQVGEVKRRVVLGPASFVPKPGEWLHTFSWHGSRGGSYKKYPGALTFQKLWLMPDQMYHDVEDVRTADDVVLTIKLMIFFELHDVEKMLSETHDPIGDFINATTSDVIDLVGRYSFDQFKTHTEKLNQLNAYTQLLERADQVGYKIRKIVYRGYATTHALQGMHEQAIEARTRLKLERETENQAQELTDFKQHRDFERATRARVQESEQYKHNIELREQQQAHELHQGKRQHEQELQLMAEKWERQRTQREQDALQEHAALQRRQEQHLAYLQQIKEMGVDLTSFLTQGRADQVIELRNNGDALSPHLHIK